jgi:hypothetical protein
MSNLSDVAGHADFLNGANYSFVPNRFCNPNSAIYLNFGHLQAPTNVYFSGDFTITGWVNVIYSQQWTLSDILNFANGQSNFVYVRLQLSDYNYHLRASTRNGQVATTPNNLNLKTWYHFAVVQIYNLAKFYINGQLVTTDRNAFVESPHNINRTTNYIGKSNDPIHRFNLNAILSDLKIYNGTLSNEQVMNDYLSSSNNGI